VQIHIPDTQAPYVISMVGSVANLVNEVLQAAVGNHFRNKLQGMPAVSFIATREAVQQGAYEYVKGELAKYRVETRGVYIQAVVLPEQLVEVLTKREIANQQVATYKMQKSAQDQRTETEKAKGTADMQADLAKSQVGVDIQSNRTAARKMEAQGEATFIEQTGAAQGAQVRSIGLARAEAYERQVAALGANATAVVNAVEALSKSTVPFMPNTLVMGGGDGGGTLGGVMAPLDAPDRRRACDEGRATDDPGVTVTTSRTLAEREPDVHPAPSSGLEHDFQTKLQLAHRHGTARFGNRPERAAAHGWNAVITGGVPVALRHRGVRVAEIRPVRQVERFEAELHVLVREAEVLDGRKVDDENARAGDGVPSEVAERPEGVHLKRRNVEPLRRTSLVGRQAGVDPGNGVRPIVAVSRSGSIDTARDGQRESRRRPDNAAELPPAEDRVHHATL
jgi:SPFH domain / Band 7 family